MKIRTRQDDGSVSITSNNYQALIIAALFFATAVIICVRFGAELLIMALVSMVVSAAFLAFWSKSKLTILSDDTIAFKYVRIIPLKRRNLTINRDEIISLKLGSNIDSGLGTGSTGSRIANTYEKLNVLTKSHGELIIAEKFGLHALQSVNRQDYLDGKVKGTLRNNVDVIAGLLHTPVEYTKIQRPLDKSIF